jgi:uncharacterized protein
MRIFSEGQCYQLMHHMEMLDHIARHSLQVGRVAMFLAAELSPLGICLNPDLIQAAALLHDITKTRSFTSGENHALTGAQLLSDLGCPEIGHLVRQHVRLDIYGDGASIDEAAIINYADKRVLHEDIVSLARRMSYIMDRYAREPSDVERIRWLWTQTEVIESRIFADLRVCPEDLPQLILPPDCGSEFRRYQRAGMGRPQGTQFGQSEPTDDET